MSETKTPEITGTIYTDIETSNREIMRLRTQVADLKRQADEMAEEIRIMKARQYGRRSEKLTSTDIRQGLLFNEAETHSSAPEAEQTVETVRITKTVYTRRKAGRTPISAKLARVENVVDVSDEEKKVDEGYELVRIGEERGEQIHEIPQKYIVITTIRPKYLKRRIAGGTAIVPESKASEFLIAPVPERILPRSIATPSLLSSVLTGKFCDGLPFNRQERIFARHGLEISRQDMANWAMAVAGKLSDLMAMLVKELLSSSYLHCDETYVQVLDEPGKENSSKSYMWVMTSSEGGRKVILFRYSRTRSAGFISSFLDTYVGYIQTDGYAGYNDIGEKQGVIHVACWAHVRRKFVEAHEAASGMGFAIEAVNLIKKLYDIERTLRALYFGEEGKEPDYEAFARERVLQVQPVFALLDAWLTEKAQAVLPSSALGKAIAYTRSLWPMLIRYVECPHLTPDNNEVERAIKPFVIGRKGWMMSGSPKGAFASADLYSLIETAKANGLEPYFYLRYVLTTLPTLASDALSSLLPWNVDPADFEKLTIEDARLSLNSVGIF